MEELIFIWWNSIVPHFYTLCLCWCCCCFFIADFAIDIDIVLFMECNTESTKAHIKHNGKSSMKLSCSVLMDKRKMVRAHFLDIQDDSYQFPDNCKWIEANSWSAVADFIFDVLLNCIKCVLSELWTCTAHHTQHAYTHDSWNTVELFHCDLLR